MTNIQKQASTPGPGWETSFCTGWDNSEQLKDPIPGLCIC